MSSDDGVRDTGDKCVVLVTCDVGTVEFYQTYTEHNNSNLKIIHENMKI